VRQLVSDLFDELITLANAQDCTFPSDFKQQTMNEMLRPTEVNSIMYQDYAAKRPMEVETYLGSPIKLAQAVGVKVPRIETLYSILHNLNIVNQQRKDTAVASPVPGNLPPRLSSMPPPNRPMMNGAVNGNGAGRGRGRTSSMNGPHPGAMRRGPPPANGGLPNGYGRPMNGNGYASRNQSRRGSMEGNDLGEEFSHLALYSDIPESGESVYGDTPELTLRERELMLRQREVALKEQEMRMGKGGGGRGGRRGPPTPSIRNGGGFDDDDDDDFIDPMDAPPVPLIDPDNFDMMSVTSKRNRKAPSASQLRKNPEFDSQSKSGRLMRPGYPRNRSSAKLISQVPGLHDSIMDDPLMGYSSNRYANVDRHQIGSDSRTNSLTIGRLDEMQYGNGGSQNGPYPRRTSNSPGTQYSPQLEGVNEGRSPLNGYMGTPPNGMRQPPQRLPSGQANTIPSPQVEQYAGVSALHPPKGNNVNVRSLTGSASASAGSSDSANIDSEPSAHSSQSSLGPRPPVDVR